MLAIENNQVAATGGAASSVPAGIVTNGPNRIVVLQIFAENSGAGPMSVDTVTASGLSFTKRKQYQFTVNSIDCVMETWWAYAPDQITFGEFLAATVTLASEADDLVVLSMAVSGVTNFSAPWCTDPSLPATIQSDSGVPSVGSVSVEATNSIMFGMFLSPANNTPSDVGAGYTSIMNSTDDGTDNFCSVLSQYQVFSSTQSSITVAADGSTTFWGWMADAISGDGGGSGGGSSEGSAAFLVGL